MCLVAATCLWGKRRTMAGRFMGPGSSFSGPGKTNHRRCEATPPLLPFSVVSMATRPDWLTFTNCGVLGLQTFHHSNLKYHVFVGELGSSSNLRRPIGVSCFSFLWPTVAKLASFVCSRSLLDTHYFDLFWPPFLIHHLSSLTKYRSVDSYLMNILAFGTW